LFFVVFYIVQEILSHTSLTLSAFLGGL